MKSNTDFTLSTDFALLLVGAPMTGKTNIAMDFPDPYFLDCDNNLSRAVKRYPGKAFYYDTIDHLEPAPEKRWLKLVEVARANVLDAKVKTVVLDSLTSAARYLEDYLVTQAGTGKDLKIGGQVMMSQSHWYPFKTMMTKFLLALRATKKLVIVCAHEKIDQDQMMETMVYRPAISGQLSDTIAGLFTDVWRTYSKVGPATPANPSGIEYKVRTVPDPRMSFLGNSRGFPPEFQFKWATHGPLITGEVK